MSSPDSATILAFGAHPDDIEFGCGGIIARETQAGRSAHFVICSQGESATHGLPGRRVAEAEKAAELLGATLEFIELGGDGHFEVNVAHAVQLAGFIRRKTPRIVLAPTVTENQHPDHSKLGRMVRDATRLARYGGVKELKGVPAHAVEHLFFYAVTPGAEPSDLARIFIDVSDPKIVAVWKAAMEAHATQRQTREYGELQLARSRVNGLLCGVGHAMALWTNDSLAFDSLESLRRSARHF
jgi:N-acetylglucosamine malate deacetylase 1